MAEKMKAAIFVEPGRIVLDDKPVPDVGPLDALMRVTPSSAAWTACRADWTWRGRWARTT
jgi:alcohol dehydrogenase